MCIVNASAGKKGRHVLALQNDFFRRKSRGHGLHTRPFVFVGREAFGWQIAFNPHADQSPCCRSP